MRLGRRVMHPGLMAGFTALAAVAFGPVQTGRQFTALLDGKHVAPPSITAATATAKFTILPGDTAVQYQLQVARLRDTWSAGIYANGGEQSGFKAVTLFVGPTYGEITGTLAEGAFTDRDMLGDITVKELVELMRNGQAYVEIRTAAHPQGELRGSIAPAGVI